MPPWDSEEIRAKVDALEIDFNAYGVDRYGVSKKELRRMYGLLSYFYRNYFQVSVSDIDRVPKRGRCMLVGNHSGGLALDGAIVTASMLLEHSPPRLVQAMVDKFIGGTPFGSLIFSRLGHLIGLPEHAVQLLEDERLLCVFPEGHAGTAKLYKDRNTLVGFGTGFVRLALQTKTPIVPFAFIGGGDAIPTISNLSRVAKVFGVPYLPVTPYLVPLPRPVPLEIYFGDAIHLEGTGNEDDSTVRKMVEKVKSEIATLIERGAAIRSGSGEASFR